jgi:uracil-DNA glycosylase family 4
VSDKGALLEAIAEEIRGHVPCGFEVCEQATSLVPGEGNADADVVFVGEAPGASEDKAGRPFVGSAGKLLDALLSEAGFERGDVFITNVVKARPPKNRDPKADEVAHHLPWLLAQLDVIAPKVVVPLGRHAMGRFVDGVTITEAHGKRFESGGRTIVPWFHPAAALHNQSLRGTLVEDARRLGETLRA